MLNYCGTLAQKSSDAAALGGRRGSAVGEHRAGRGSRDRGVEIVEIERLVQNIDIVLAQPGGVVPDGDAIGGAEDDRNRGGRGMESQKPANVKTALTGFHAHVEQHRIRLLASHGVKGAQAVGAGQRLPPFVSQRLTDIAEKVEVVVDDRNTSHPLLLRLPMRMQPQSYREPLPLSTAIFLALAAASPAFGYAWSNVHRPGECYVQRATSRHSRAAPFPHVRRDPGAAGGGCAI